MNFFAGLMLLRVGAGATLVWLRLHPADWSPFAAYGLRGVCWACLAASLTRYVVRSASGKSAVRTVLASCRMFVIRLQRGGEG
jgi:hypothetical protein